MPAFSYDAWFGLLAPAGTSPAGVNKLNAEVAKIVANPEVRAEWAKRGAVGMTMTPDEFSRYVGDDIAEASAALERGQSS